MTKEPRQKFKYLEKEKSLEDDIKSIVHLFQRVWKNLFSRVWLGVRDDLFQYFLLRGVWGKKNLNCKTNNLICLKLWNSFLASSAKWRDIDCCQCMISSHLVTEKKTFFRPIRNKDQIISNKHCQGLLLKLASNIKQN